jgi:hypothetical protein
VGRAVVLDPWMLRVAAPGPLDLPADLEWRKLRRPALRSQLNQIRLWLRQGRTEAWIAHKLDISVAALEQFKRDNQLGAGASAETAQPEPSEIPPERPPSAPPPLAGEEPKEELERRPDSVGTGASLPETSPSEVEAAGSSETEAPEGPPAAAAAPEETELEPTEIESESDDEPSAEPAERPRRRRRGRRGGRRRRAKRAQYEATFDHGEDGYGLRLDPAVAENPVYAKHWAGQRTVAVTLDPDAITIRRVEEEEDEQEEEQEPRD